MAKYKICPVCGNQFKTCTVCENSSAPQWKKYSDSFEHYDIYTTVILYTRHNITKKEAADRLKSYPKKGYKDSIQKYLDEIFTIADDPQVKSDVALERPSVIKRRRRNKESVFGQNEME